MSRPKIFVITPFQDDFLQLYEELKETFDCNFEFTRAGDLNTCHNILKDIVQGIENAHIVLADITGLNPNVFYELGLAHAMHKKVIMITQNIEELPFDIRSYKIIKYGMHFNEVKSLKSELSRLFMGFADGSMEFGNPVTDFSLNLKNTISQTNFPIEIVKEEEFGFLDYFVKIIEQFKKLKEEILSIETFSEKFKTDIEEYGRKTMKNINFKKYTLSNAKNVLSDFSNQILPFNLHIQEKHENIYTIWNNIDSSYKLLLKNEHLTSITNVQEIKELINVFETSTKELNYFQSDFDYFMEQLSPLIGYEKSLTQAIKALKNELENFKALFSSIVKSLKSMILESHAVVLELERTQ